MRFCAHCFTGGLAMTLRSIGWLADQIPDDRPERSPRARLQRAYRIARETPEITVRLGKQLFIVEEKFHAHVAHGGRALAGGWRHEPPNDASV
jgi:hypothetical protein